MKIEDYDYLTYEFRNDAIIVHGWSTYPENSVLAGQDMKCFVDSFNTVEEALKEYPDAEASHPLLQPQNTFNHLPDTQDDDYFYREPYYEDT